MNIPVVEFLRPFFDAQDKICLRIFTDRRNDDVFRGAKMETDLGGIEKIQPVLEEHNSRNRGIFFVVNTGGHEDNDITRINAQFMEIDDGSFEEQWAKIHAFPLEPSIVVKTRKSLHTYWLVRNADVAAFRGIQRALAEYFGGDRTCVNESRVLRLPGFYHCKAEPIMVECVKYNPELRYTQQQLAEVLPGVEEYVRKSEVVQKGDRPGLDSVLRRCDFMKHCAMDAATLPEHDWYAMISNLAVFEGGEKKIHELSAGYPGYNAAETQDKIQHFLASGTRPMTCATIAEKGWKCPKMLDGSCTCKAPAAMCYQPMDVDELRVALEALPVGMDVLSNLRAAKAFIQSALYNVEPVDAAPFIDYAVRDHFRLKATDTKNLVAFQRGLYKDYSGRHDTRQETAGSELPEWYEVTERGGIKFMPGVLADHMAATRSVFYGAGSFFSYNRGVYSPQDDLWAANTVRSNMLSRNAQLNAINDACGQWRMMICRKTKEINPNPFIMNVKNGLLNVLDGSFREHTPEYLSTVQIGAAYRPELLENADYGCPIFLEFLRGVLNPPEVNLLQEIFGYLLVPVNKAQKSFVFVGAANAGKSTLLNVAQEVLLKPENVSNIAWQALSERFNKAELFGKLANVFADLPSKAIDDNGLFKAVTGEDYITAERKNKDPFTFRPYARLLFSCNEMPRNISDRSNGFYRRLIIIRFAKSVPPEKRDVALKEKIACEADGILMWALEGLKRLMANNYNFSETAATRAELLKYKTENSSSLSFAEIYLTADPDATAPRDDVYEAYKNFCHECGFKTMSRVMFNRDIESKFESATRSRDGLARRAVWHGIKFHPEGVN